MFKPSNPAMRIAALAGVTTTEAAESARPAAAQQVARAAGPYQVRIDVEALDA